MITPFVPIKQGRPSYGVGGFSYDIRLGETFLLPLYNHIMLDPINFPKDKFVEVVAPKSLVIEPGSYILGESVESFNMPEDIMGICYSKSTYARCGLSVNATILQPGWRGKLTLELANLGRFPINLHVKQGIAQIVFMRGSRPDNIYGDVGNELYQDQDKVSGPR